jgi:phenylacetate-CoA ligase
VAKPLLLPRRITIRAFGTPFAELREQYHQLLAERFSDRAGRLAWRTDELAAHQRAGLRRVLAHAREHSPFYARRLASVDVDRFEIQDLAGLPVLGKPELMHELDDVFTDRRLSRGLIEQALATTGPEPVPIFGRYLAQVSGGSSYHRGLFVSDLDNTVDGALCVLRSTSSPGSAPPAGGLRIAMIAAGSSVHGTGLVSALNPPGAGPAAIVSVPAILPIDEIVRRVEEIDPHVLSGYPTVLARLAQERSSGRLRAEPYRIQTTSERLTPALRRIIDQGFGAPIIDVFGCTEGLMGVTAPGGTSFTFNSDLMITELVDEEDRPVPPGTRSSAVLLTSIGNLTQPLIRYRLTDRLRQTSSEGSALLQAAVDGLDVTLFRYHDVAVHPFGISAALLRRTDLLDYQIIQTAGGVQVAVIADHTADLDELRHEVAGVLVAAGLDHPEVVVVQVAELGRYRDSGKVSRYVPLDARQITGR